MGLLLCLIFVFVAVLANAQSFDPPEVSAPGNASLNTLTDVTDFLKLEALGRQDVLGPLIIASSTAATTTLASAFFGDATDLAAVIGVAGSGNFTTLPALGVASSAVYGYATGGAASYGIYGYGVGASGVGILGKTAQANGFAGYFLGKVGAESTPWYVEETMTASKVVASSTVAADPGLTASNGIKVAGSVKHGLYGQSPAHYAVYGLSDYNSGVYGQNTIDAAVAGTTFIGVRGSSFDLTGQAGVYGLSASGNGAKAVVGSASTLATVQGTATNGTGKAVYGRGGAYAGYFDGDVVINPGYSVSVGSYSISISKLRTLMQWCNQAACGSANCTFCPDASY